jgi:o-succinylbenzoate---CoA ligase
MDYPFQSIHLNNRAINIEDILAGNASGEDEFEKNTISFIRDWCRGREEFVLTTSGSTGNPKSITITRRQMEWSAKATAQALPLKKGMSSLVCLDTRYIAGQMMLVRSLCVGLQIHAVTPSANPFEEHKWGKKIDFVAFVPYQLHTILRSVYAPQLNSIETIIVGGSPLSADDEELLQTYSCRVYLTYGMTETISHIALKAINGQNRSLYFHTLPGISIRTDDRSCLIIKCPYISDEVVTNDIVNVVNQTTFDWVGRYDNVINSGGVKIHPEKVEKLISLVFKRLNLHGRFAVSSIPDPVLGEKAVIVTEAMEVDDTMKNEIVTALRGLLQKFELPKEILMVPSFPETDTGKLNRHELRKALDKRL